MSEPTARDRATMIVKTVASIMGWVGALAVKFVRGKLKRPAAKSGT